MSRHLRSAVPTGKTLRHGFSPPDRYDRVVVDSRNPRARHTRTVSSTGICIRIRSVLRSARVPSAWVFPRDCGTGKNLSDRGRRRSWEAAVRTPIFRIRLLERGTPGEGILADGEAQDSGLPLPCRRRFPCPTIPGSFRRPADDRVLSPGSRQAIDRGSIHLDVTGRTPGKNSRRGITMPTVLVRPNQLCALAPSRELSPTPALRMERVRLAA